MGPYFATLALDFTLHADKAEANKRPFSGNKPRRVVRFGSAVALMLFFGAVCKGEEGMVTAVFGGSAGPNTVAIGDVIEVRTENLDGWLNSKLESGLFNDDPLVIKYWKDYGGLILGKWDQLENIPKEKQDLVPIVRGEYNAFIRRRAADLRLVIDDVRFEDLKPEIVEMLTAPKETNATTVFRSTYRLIRNADNNATWQQLLRRFKFERPVRLTLGLKVTNGTWVFMPTNITPDPNPAKSPLRMQLVDTWRFLGALGLIFFALIVFALLVGPTDLLRDTGAVTRPAKNGEQEAYPFSLARSQMAFWFFLVASAYLFIWLTTERLDGLNQQVLGLIGISAGTALGVAFVTAGKGPCRTIDEEQARAVDPTLSSAEREAASRRAARLIAQRERLAKSSPFMRLMDDWLTEDGAVSFHRFQMMAWTLVLGLIFFSHVCTNYAMPDFSGTTLALMGISSGTYLGFKLPDTR